MTLATWESKMGGRARVVRPPARPSSGHAGDWYNPVDDVSAVASAVADVTTSAWDDVKNTVPGAQAISDAFDSFATGPLRDFARKNPIAPVVLTAVSGGAYALAAPIAGAQLAAVTFALPGMAKGENFVHAWVEGFVDRVTALVAYFIGHGVPANVANVQIPQQMSDEMQKVTDYVQQSGVDLSQVDLKGLAARAGVREDVAAHYLANALGDLKLPDHYEFDDATGKATPLQTAAQKLQAVADAMARRVAAEQAAKTTGALSQARSSAFQTFAKQMILPPPKTASSAPELGPLAGVELPTPAAAAPASGLSGKAKAGLGAAGLAALAALFFL